MKLTNLIVTAALFAGALTAQADVKSGFKAAVSSSKGPFGLNYLQGTAERRSIDGGSPENFLFQAAFRNEDARAFAEAEGIYLGNLYTTNLYELMGEYVYNDAYGSHDVDQNALLANAPAAMPKATLMVQNWVLEKHYVEHYPDSKLSRAFKLRGISGSEFEQVWANYFFNFYLSSIDGDFQYLPAFLLSLDSPIVASAGLEKARNMIASSYDSFLGNLGQSHPMVKALYRLRNAIHNQLSPDVIPQIDEFNRQFPEYKEQGHTYLFIIRDILVEYYSFNAAKLAKMAAAIGQKDLQAAAEVVANEGVSAENLLALSERAAELRGNIVTPAVPFKSKAQALALLANTAKLLNKELQVLKRVNKPEVATAIINTIYVEGFLIKDNWEYFKVEASTSSDLGDVLNGVIEIGGEATLSEAFAPVLDKWLQIEPEMQYFVDNTIKSSALNTAALTVEKLRK